MKKQIPAFTSLILIMTFIACSKSSSPSYVDNGGNNSGGNTSVNTVTMSGMSFSPGSITVKTGTTITFKNSDNVAHTATADGGSFDTGNIAAGASATITFSTAGNFPYHCKYHSGMTGTIVVQN